MPPRVQPVHGRGSKPSWTSDVPMRIKAFGISPDPFTGAYLQDRVGFKFGKFARYVQGLEIRIRNAVPSRDEPLVSCTLAVALATGGPLLVERYAYDPREAFDHAIGVAERLLRHRLQRLRHLHG